MEEKKKKSKGSLIVIILLVIVILGLVGYICYDKGIILKGKKDEAKNTHVVKTENNDTETNTSKDVEEGSNDKNIKEVLTNKSTGGNYKIYMNSYGHSDSLIILYNSKDFNQTNEKGYFVFIGGSFQGFEAYEGGRYSIEGSKIRFSASLDENGKKTFINQFQISDSDLIDDNGMSYVDFNYTEEKINISNKEYTLVTK